MDFTAKLNIFRFLGVITKINNDSRLINKKLNTLKLVIKFEMFSTLRICVVRNEILNVTQVTFIF